MYLNELISAILQAEQRILTFPPIYGRDSKMYMAVYVNTTTKAKLDEDAVPSHVLTLRGYPIKIDDAVPDGEMELRYSIDARARIY